MDNEVVIVVSSRDKSDPEAVRRRWRATQTKMEHDSRTSGDRSGKGWLSGFGDAAGDESGLGRLMKAITGSFTSVFRISAKTAATAFSAQFVGSVVAGLASGVAKIAHGAASIAALLPAAALTGVTAMSTLKLAVAEVGDALSAAVTGDAKEFDDAIKGLSPSARGFAREIRGLRGELKGLQQSVQDRFFSQFESQTTRLAKQWLPILRFELGAVAEGFGDTVDSFASWARQPGVVLTLTSALRNARGAIANVLAGATNLAQAFLPLVAVGSTFLPRLTRGFGDATGKLALFMQNAADTGKLADFIQGGLDKLHSLGDTFGQLWRIGGNVIAVLKEFGSVGGGVFAALGIQTGGLLDSLETLTDKAKTFFQSAAGGQAITEIFSIVKSLLGATMGTLAHLAAILGRTFGPILPQLSKFAESVANIQLALADGMEPALQAIADLAADVLPVITSILDAMAENATVMAGVAGVVVGLYAVWKAGAVAAKLAQADLNFTMAGAAAAAAGFSMALIQIDSARHAAQVKNMAEAFESMDGAVNDQTRTWVYMAQLMGGLDEVMGQIIASNPRVAQGMLDNADALGITAEEAAKYQAQLDQTTAATDNQVDALTRQKNAMRALTDPVFAAMDAQDRLREAQEHLIEVEKDQNSTAADIQQAHQDVARAATDNQAAQYDLAAAVESGDTSLEAYLDSLKRQVKQGAITRDDYNATALVAAAAFGSTKRNIEAVPTHHSTRLTATDYASAVANKVAAKFAWLSNQTYTVHLAASYGAAVAQALGFYAHGGITGAAGGGPRSRRTWVGEHGPELVDMPPGAMVHSNADSQRIAAQGGMVEVHLVVDAGGGSADQFVGDMIRRFVKVRSGGNVQAALGWSR